LLGFFFFKLAKMWHVAVYEDRSYSSICPKLSLLWHWRHEIWICIPYSWGLVIVGETVPVICICDMNLELNAIVITLHCGKPHYSNHERALARNVLW